MRRLAVWVTAAIAAVVAWPSAAGAHPLGDFTVNTASALEISRTQVTVRYAADIAEVPTFRELAVIDADRDGDASDAELEAYARAKSAEVRAGLTLRIDGAAAALSAGDAHAELLPGDGGLRVLRLDTTFTAALPRERALIEYRDGNFEPLSGWREITAITTDGQGLAATDVPVRSGSEFLRAYPTDVSKPPRVSSARIEVAPGAMATPPEPPTSELPAAAERPDRFGSLVDRDLAPLSVALALAAAFAFGAMHALGPGHGKAVTGAYLAGGDARARDAVNAGLAIAAMHSASVIALGLVTLWLTNLLEPATAYPWLSLAAGLVVLGFGARLLVTRLRERGEHHEHTHTHAPVTRGGLAALAVSGGLLPSPTAVVVLLGSVALGRLAFGLALIATFSLGIAAALTLVGLAVMRARAFASPRMKRASSVVPILSSVVIVLAGVALTARAAYTLAVG